MVNKNQVPEFQKTSPQTSPKTSIEDLENEIRRHNRLYFEEQQPEISDYEFDQLVERLKDLKPDSPLLTEIPSDNPTKETKKIRHRIPMLSLDKCYTEADLHDWASKFEGDLIAMPKIDGCATELRYSQNGELILGATRGDGVDGEDITAHVKSVLDIPQKISLPPHLVKGESREFEIRGEIYMKLSVFEKYKSEFANPRNLAAGAIKLKDPQKTSDYSLSFFGYDVLGIDFKTEVEKFQFLRSLSIPTVEIKEVTKERMQETYDYFLSIRAQDDFETDGVVFKANLVSEQIRLKSTAHHPRYAMAYKFQGDSGLTTLQNVEWNVSRTGTITPVGIISPVQLSGALVTRVSLHNYGLMKNLGLRQGSRVIMMRRGGVIPNLESVVETGDGPSFEPPTQCPSCHSPTEIRDDFLYCTNRSGCRKSKIQELEHFMKVIECDGFGEKLIEKLYDNGFVKDPADYYTLKKENLLELERMGDILATKLISNIQTRTILPLDIFLRALGIRELAKHTAKILVTNFGTLEKILTVSEEELSVIHTLGPVIAREVVEGLKKKRELIEKLRQYVVLEARLSPPALDEEDTKTAPLQNKKFVFTGSLLSMSRSEAQKLVEEMGGEALESVVKDLDYLVVGDGGGSGSKLEKAKKLQEKGARVKIISETEWREMIKNQQRAY